MPRVATLKVAQSAYDKKSYLDLNRRRTNSEMLRSPVSCETSNQVSTAHPSHPRLSQTPLQVPSAPSSLPGPPQPGHPSAVSECGIAGNGVGPADYDANPFSDSSPDVLSSTVISAGPASPPSSSSSPTSENRRRRAKPRRMARIIRLRN